MEVASCEPTSQSLSWTASAQIFSLMSPLGEVLTPLWNRCRPR